jgi:hypothetical protein
MSDRPDDTEELRDADQPRDADEPRDPDQPRDADELADAVSDLGETNTDRLQTVSERNESLAERVPSDDDLPRTKGSPGQG